MTPIPLIMIISSNKSCYHNRAALLDFIISFLDAKNQVKVTEIKENQYGSTSVRFKPCYFWDTLG